MGKPTGEKMTAPVSYSKASVTYRKGDAHIEATLVDSGFNQLLLLPYTWIQNMGYEKETEHGYEKAVKVAGHPGFEKWDSAGKRRRSERVREQALHPVSSKARTSMTRRSSTSSRRTRISGSSRR